MSAPPKLASADTRRPRILYLAPDIVLDLPGALSQYLTGDYVTLWPKARDADAEQDRARIRSGFGSFGFHPTPLSRLPFGFRQLRDLWFFLGTGLRLSRGGNVYDAVVTYGPYRTALAGLILRSLGRARRLLVELPMDPTRVFAFDTSRIGRLKHALSPGFVGWMVRKADHLMILYEGQLAAVGLPTTLPATIVRPFVRVRSVPPAGQLRKVILLVGKPLFLKGADVLLAAWKQINARFPDFRVCIAGSDEPVPEYRQLAQAAGRVDFLGRLDHNDVLQLMASSYLIVLPSRTEGVPRVLVEAMAAARPVVASSVGGIPSLVQHGVTGLLCPPEDALALAGCLERLLADPEEADRLGKQGARVAREGFTEQEIARQWRLAVDAAAAAPSMRGRP